MTETGKRYGTSLYELAAEEGLTEGFWRSWMLLSTQCRSLAICAC